MGEDFVRLIDETLSQPKRIQEISTILSRVMEIVINAIDMLEQNLNNLSKNLEIKIGVMESRINAIESRASLQVPVSTAPQDAAARTAETAIRPSGVSPTAPASAPASTSPTPTPATTPTAAPTAAPGTAPVGAQGGAQPPRPARPISPINVRRALNMELKQLFTKLKTQSE